MSKFSRFGRASLAVVIAGVLLAACTSKEERVQEHYKRGMQLAHDGEVAKAGLEFRNALQIDAENVPALYALADAEQQQGRADKAAGFYQRVTELDPRNIDARVRLSHIILAAGAIDQAAKLAQDAMLLDGTRADVLLLNAAVSFKKRDMMEATSLAKAVLKLEPKSADAMMLLAAVSMDAGDAAGALAFLDDALKGQETNIGLNLFKIRVLEALGKNAEVEKVLLGLVELIPDYLPGRLALVKWYSSAGKLDKAESTFRTLIGEQPDNVDLELSFVDFLNTGRGQKAAQVELEKKVNLPNSDYRYRVALARLQFAGGQTSQAMDLLRAFVDKDAAQAETLAVKAELATMLLASNDEPAANELIEAVLKVDPRHVAALMQRAIIRIRRKDLEAAIADLRSALAEAPHSPQVNLILAEAYELAGHLELAEERLVATVADAAYEPSAARPYLQFLWRYKKLERLEDVLSRVLNHSPSDVDILMQLADVRLRTGNWTGAQEVADAIRKASDAPAADQITATVLYGQKQYDASLALLKNVQDGTATSGNSMAFLVRSYMAAGKAEEAKAFLRSVIEKDPKNAEAEALLGTVAMAGGDKAGALAGFQRALELEPDRENRYQTLVEFHARAGDLAAAEAVLEQGLVHLPNSTVLRISQAGIMESKGEFEAAIKAYEGALETDPLSLVAVNNLASLLADYRTDTASLERAYVLSRRLTDLDVPFFQDTVGWVLYRRGEYDGAERALSKAAQGLPGLPIVHYHLGKANQALGKTALAVGSLEKSLQLAGKTDFPQRDLAKAAIAEISAGKGKADGTAVTAPAGKVEPGDG